MEWLLNEFEIWGINNRRVIVYEIMLKSWFNPVFSLNKKSIFFFLDIYKKIYIIPNITNFIFLPKNKMIETLKNNVDANAQQTEMGKQVNSSRDQIAESLKSEKEYFAQKIGSYLHEEWRKTRLNEDGTYEPRMKKSKDLARTQKHGTDEVDIANTIFEDLPSNWQYENLEAAKVAVDLVYEKVINGEEITSEMIEEMSSVVHEKWLERNDWVYDKDYWNPILAQSYNLLPEEEKAKDRAQIEAAIQIIKSEK